MIVHNDWLLTPQRAAVHLPTRTAVIADLHLGYDRVRCRGGDALPAFGIDDAIAALGPVVANVSRIVIAGDLCEDGRCAAEAIELFNWLKRSGVKLAAVVPGNHDRDLQASGFPHPLFPDGIHVGAWRVVHGEGRLPRGQVIQGHEHPCLRWGRRLAAPCYLVGKRRMVLPAFSLDAAGTSILTDRRWRGYRCFVVSPSATLDFGPVSGLRRRLALH